MKIYPQAIISATRGRATKFRIREEKVTLLKELAIKGKTPSWAVREIAMISLILRGSLGNNLMIFGKKRIIEKVAANVS